MWTFRKPLHPVAEDYREGRAMSSPRRRAPLSGLRIVVVDAETTGLDLSRDRLLSLAAADISTGTLPLANLHSWLVYQPRAALNDAVAVHGITPSQTARGEPEEKVLFEFLDLIRGAVLVGHHVNFDAAIIEQALVRHYGTRLYNPLIDTAALAMAELEAFRRTGYANQRPPGLEEVCSHCSIPMMERHTAEGDVFTTAELFLLLCARRRRRLGRPLEWRDMPSVRP